MSKVKIVGCGSKAELWVDNHMIGKDVDSYELTHKAGELPKLHVTYRVNELEVESDNVEVGEKE